MWEGRGLGQSQSEVIYIMIAMPSQPVDVFYGADLLSTVLCLEDFDTET
jgi:hypothetical protein